MAMEAANARALELEGLLGAPRRVRLTCALSSALSALGRHALACALAVRLLEDMRTCEPHRAEWYGAVSTSDVARLRLLGVRAAFACGEWDVAHAQLRGSCLVHPDFPLNWALFNAVSGRARSRGYDERWLMRLLAREPSAPLIATGVAHHKFLNRSFKIALLECDKLPHTTANPKPKPARACPARS